MSILSNSDLVDLYLNKVVEYHPEVFLEVGCCEASASKHVKKFIPNCQVFAYDADPKAFINYNIELKDLGIIHTWAAMSNKDTDTIFYIQDPSIRKTVEVWGNNSLKTKPYLPTKYVEFPIKSYRLDTLHTQDKTYCIWMDVEGLTFQVLQGAEGILKNTKYILLEVESKQLWDSQVTDAEVIVFLQNKGFKIIASDREYTHQYNILVENQHMSK